MNTFQECKAVMEAKPNRYRFDAANHVHLLDGQPLVGTSSAMGVVAKPLTYWSSGLAVMQFGCPDPKMLTKIKNGKATEADNKAMFKAAEAWLAQYGNHLDPMQLVSLWDKAYRAHATTLKEKAATGTDLHAELERFVRDEMTGDRPKSVDEYPKQIWPFIEWSRSNVKQFLWSEAHCYSEEHWIGGICDCGLILNDGRVGIIDFKSSKEAYLTQHWQCGGYAVQIELNGTFDAEGNEIDAYHTKFDFTAIVPFGAPIVKPHLHEDVEASKRNFLNCLAIHNALPKQ
jgi:hypothetical protein